MRGGPDHKASESDADLLPRLGTDAQAWARAFITRAAEVKDLARSEGALTAWFANAIKAGRTAGQLDAAADETPPYEPETCGTHHLIAERALRILERPLAETVDSATVEALRDLASEAGVAFARIALRDPCRDVPW